MNPQDHGFRGTFTHRSGERYTVLFKGMTLVEAARQAEAECAEHGVGFVDLAPWMRSTPPKSAVYWSEPAGPRFSC